MSLTSSTLVGSSGGGLYGFGSANVDITNTLIASSTSGANCPGNDFFNTAGNNLDTDGSCLALSTGGGSPAQVTVFELKLGPLRANSGRTQSHALLKNSVAIDAGD